MNTHWTPCYEACPAFRDTYNLICDDPGTWDWPEVIQLLGRKLYRQGILCVPTNLTPYVIRMAHEACGHIKGPQLRR